MAIYNAIVAMIATVVSNGSNGTNWSGSKASLFACFVRIIGGAYERLLPEDKHLITKRFTQSIERQNLSFRTRIKRLQRKTICFSKSVEMHDKVVGEFINRELFQVI